MAGPAVVTHYRRPGAHPAVLAVEPGTAAGLLASLHAGEPVAVPTANTVMAGLNCGTVSAAAWPVLRAGCDAAVAVTDQAALGPRRTSAGWRLRWPQRRGRPGRARAALTRPERRAALGLSADAVVVLLSTEGSAPGDG